MLKKLRRTYSGLMGVIKYEGVKSLCSRGYKYICHSLFFAEDFYVSRGYIQSIEEGDESRYLPKIDNYCYRIITTNQEADELIAEGFKFGAYELNLRTVLDKEVLAYCIFIDNELAHMICKAVTQRGKKAVDPRPFHVDFESGSAVAGKAFTVPKYRQLHLRAYSGFLLRKYNREQGINHGYGTLEVHNYPAIANTAYNPHARIMSRCKYLRLLWFKYFKETPLDSLSYKEVLDNIPEKYKKKS